MKETILNKIISTGETKAFVRWLDSTGRYMKEEISAKEYANLATNPYPAKPVSYLGTEEKWQQDWRENKAIAFDGRPVVDTPTGEPGDGDVFQWDNGSVTIFSDDWDNSKSIHLKPEEFSGELPNITILSTTENKDYKTQRMDIQNGVLTKI